MNSILKTRGTLLRISSWGMTGCELSWKDHLSPREEDPERAVSPFTLRRQRRKG